MHLISMHTPWRNVCICIHIGAAEFADISQTECFRNFAESLIVNISITNAHNIQVTANRIFLGYCSCFLSLGNSELKSSACLVWTFVNNQFMRSLNLNTNVPLRIRDIQVFQWDNNYVCDTVETLKYCAWLSNCYIVVYAFNNKAVKPLGFVWIF